MSQFVIEFPPEIFSTLSRMIKMGVTVDDDTLEYYCLDYCDASKPKELLVKLQKLDIPTRRITSCMIAVYLKNGFLEEALTICEWEHFVFIKS